MKFKNSWKSSKQSRKQRKYRTNAPQHIKGRFLRASLSKPLREKHKTRSLRVRKGDEVEVLRGQFKGKRGLVEAVDTDRYKVVVRNVDVIKRDGSKTPYPVNVSNLSITKVSEDRRRFKNDKKSS